MRNLKINNFIHLSQILGVKPPPNAEKINWVNLLSLTEDHADDSFFSNNSVAVYGRFGKEIDHIAN